MELQPGTVERNRLFAPALLLLASLTLLLRMDDFDFINENVLGDDGAHLNSAQELKWESVWTPYGYLMLFNRVVALAAIQLPREIIPYVLFASWMGSFIALILVLKHCCETVGLGRWSVVCLVCAISLQPNYPECFFYFASSQYFLGGALAFYTSVPSYKKISASEIVFLVVASLTGPMSIFMIPVLALQLLILKDISRRLVVYMIVSVCGLIQLLVVIGTGRGGMAGFGDGLVQWLPTVTSFVSFGSSGIVGWIAAVLFWLTFLIVLWRWVRSRDYFRSNFALWLSPPIAAALAVFLFIGSAMSIEVFIGLLSPLGHGSRYFLVPYSLIFFVAVLCSKDGAALRVIVIVLLGLICAVALRPVGLSDAPSRAGLLSRVNLQWVAYTRFQKIRPELVIPISPPWPVYPPVWNVRLGEADSTHMEVDVHVLRSVETKRPVVDSGDARGLHIGMEGHTIQFSIEEHCAKSPYLALEVDVWRSQMGWARVAWGSRAGFKPKDFLERFYPAGHTRMQFAFGRSLDDSVIRLDLAEGVYESEVLRTLHSAPFKWLREGLMSGPGMVLGQVTDPGGEVRLGEVRLLCLN